MYHSWCHTERIASHICTASNELETAPDGVFEPATCCTIQLCTQMQVSVSRGCNAKDISCFIISVTPLEDYRDGAVVPFESVWMLCVLCLIVLWGFPLLLPIRV